MDANAKEKLLEELLTLVEKKARIPKPVSDNPFTIKGTGKRRGELAVIYYIPNHDNPNKPHQKGITVSEFLALLNEAQMKGEVTREWFNNNLPACAKEGGCNFTSACGILELLGYLKYVGDGLYKYNHI